MRDFQEIYLTSNSVLAFDISLDLDSVYKYRIEQEDEKELSLNDWEKVIFQEQTILIVLNLRDDSLQKNVIKKLYFKENTTVKEFVQRIFRFYNKSPPVSQHNIFNSLMKKYLFQQTWNDVMQNNYKYSSMLGDTTFFVGLEKLSDNMYQIIFE